MKQLGHKVQLGEKITDKQKEDFGAYMAKILFEVIEEGPVSPMAKQLMVTPPFVNYRGLKQVQHIVFSGGVSEHVYDRDPKSYGDIGPVLGKNTRAHLQRLPKEILREPTEGIRATVIGAGESDALALVLTVIDVAAAVVLGHSGPDRIDPDRPFQELLDGIAPPPAEIGERLDCLPLRVDAGTDDEDDEVTLDRGGDAAIERRRLPEGELAGGAVPPE